MASHRNRPGLPLPRAVDELILTTILLFAVVTMVRWLRDPHSPLYVSGLRAALLVVAVASGLLVVALILSPPGRRSGGHMNPAVTVALWLMDVFPGRSVLPYAAAQMAGSVIGVALARLVWGPVTSTPSIGYAAIRPGPHWDASSVFLAEAGCFVALTLVIGFFLAHPVFGRWLPYLLGLSIALIIVCLGTQSGGSVNPARHFGPALFAGDTNQFWIYVFAPVLGAVLGASVHHLLMRRLHTHQPLTYKLCGTPQRSERQDESA
ncbi:MIP/aquaporin family protein [Streptomyces sp. NPDC089424]|uniref:MIP/aquaporin family protein n=1 Tax=Streptomyces sp. NPDC089424 TaxID=3365917 RepID=UPI003806E081